MTRVDPSVIKAEERPDLPSSETIDVPVTVLCRGENVRLNEAYDNKDVMMQIALLKKGKQDKLTAGDNITIEDNVISAYREVQRAEWGYITGTMSSQEDLNEELTGMTGRIDNNQQAIESLDEVKADASSVYTKDETYDKQEIDFNFDWVDSQLSTKADLITLDADVAILNAVKQNKLTAGAGITITNDIISCSVPGFTVEIVQVLPATGVVGVIYLVRQVSPTTEDTYNEYIWVNNGWERLGTTKIDLSAYKIWSETKAYIDAKTPTIEVL